MSNSISFQFPFNRSRRSTKTFGKSIMNPYETPKTLATSWRRRGVIWGLFHYRLSRIPFAALLFAHEYWCITMLESENPLKGLLILASMPLALVLVILPRVRDCDWPWWVAVTAMIPYLGAITGTGLFFASSKYVNRTNDSDSPRPEFHPEP